MVPTPQVEGHVTSIESQPDRAHPIFDKPELLAARVGDPLRKIVAG